MVLYFQINHQQCFCSHLAQLLVHFIHSTLSASLADSYILQRIHSFVSCIIGLDFLFLHIFTLACICLSVKGHNHSSQACDIVSLCERHSRFSRRLSSLIQFLWCTTWYLLWLGMKALAISIWVWIFFVSSLILRG